MQILCLTSRLPYPPNRGDRLRAFNFIKHLSNEHELHLVSFIADESEREHVEVLEAYCQDVQVVQRDIAYLKDDVGLERLSSRIGTPSRQEPTRVGDSRRHFG